MASSARQLLRKERGLRLMAARVCVDEWEWEWDPEWSENATCTERN